MASAVGESPAERQGEVLAMRKSETPDSRLLGRRSFLQAGTIGALGLSMTGVASSRARSGAPSGTKGGGSGPRAVIFLFLTGGPSQHDTFDMKPNGPAEYKGEFDPIATCTPGIRI